MVAAILQWVLLLVAKAILGIVILCVLVPVVWLITAPFILIGTFFVKGSYSENVRSAMATVTEKWVQWGFSLFVDLPPP